MSAVAFSCTIQVILLLCLSSSQLVERERGCFYSQDGCFSFSTPSPKQLERAFSQELEYLPIPHREKGVNLCKDSKAEGTDGIFSERRNPSLLEKKRVDLPSCRNRNRRPRVLKGGRHFLEAWWKHRSER